MSSSALSQASPFKPTDILAARRELAHRSVADFARMAEIPTVPVSDEVEEDRFETLRIARMASHHDILLDALQDVADGHTPNLMVFMPPGSAKSTYVDVVFVPWFLARKPKQNVILTSYGSDLARKQGRRARQLVKSRSFRNLFDCMLSSDNGAADEWGLTNGSEYMAGGILSGVTGNRADLLVIDDPVKGREEADSEAIRKKTLEAYQDDLTTRLKPGGRQVIIQTRWSEADLSGEILPADWDGESGLIECRDGRTWRVLRVPAIADRADDPIGRKIGETLWPEWFTPEHWLPFKRNQRTWSALYQQKPSPDEGTFFRRDDLPEWKERPKHLRIYGSSDYAVTDGGGDYTVHRIWGIDEADKIYRLDGWRGQTAADEWIERKIDLIAKHKPLAWFGEAGVIEKAVKPMLLRRMRERQVHCRMEWLPSIHDKATRARGFQARASMGMVCVEPGADISEFLSFPAGKHDDEVDVAGLIGRALDQVHRAIVPSTVKPTNPDDRYRPRQAGGGDGWKVQ